jgi:hypothetical protein
MANEQHGKGEVGEQAHQMHHAIKTPLGSDRVPTLVSPITSTSEIITMCNCGSAGSADTDDCSVFGCGASKQARLKCC